MKKTIRLFKITLLLPVVMTVSGCANFEPWVKPYERDRLADPIMKFDQNPVSSAYTHHIYDVRESARGGLGASGGGCGCN